MSSILVISFYKGASQLSELLIWASRGKTLGEGGRLMREMCRSGPDLAGSGHYGSFGEKALNNKTSNGQWFPARF